jgi:hypothetical protein
MDDSCGQARLKYRAWDHLMGSFVHLTARDSFGRVPADIPDDHLQQCTGLRDIDGNLVYEGDIVEFDDSDWSLHPSQGRAEVVRCSDLTLVDSPCWRLHSRDGFHRGMLGKMKIVGNNFQNPDLVSGAGSAQWAAGVT